MEISVLKKMTSRNICPKEDNFKKNDFCPKEDNLSKYLSKGRQLTEVSVQRKTT